MPVLFFDAQLAEKLNDRLVGERILRDVISATLSLIYTPYFLVISTDRLGSSVRLNVHCDKCFIHHKQSFFGRLRRGVTEERERLLNYIGRTRLPLVGLTSREKPDLTESSRPRPL